MDKGKKINKLGNIKEEPQNDSSVDSILLLDKTSTM